MTAQRSAILPFINPKILIVEPERESWRKGHLFKVTNSLPDKGYQSQWELRTEYIIAMLGVGFALFLFGLNLFFGIKSSPEINAEHLHEVRGEHIAEYAYWIYPLICGGRLAWLHFCPSGKIFIWSSAIIDILFLTIIIYAFSLKYESPSASLLAPTYGFYYVIIALHAMRFNARLVIFMGLSTIVIWAIMLLSFLKQGASVTQNYAQYISSTDILIGSEVEKLIALGLFSLLLAIGVKRAKDLLSEAAEKRISDVKMIESERASRVKTEFLATMSHELRTPLNGVLGMSEILKTTALTETQANFVGIIEQSGQDLLSIIEDILDYTQLEADETTREVRAFQLIDVIAKVSKKLKPEAEKKTLDFHIKVEGPKDISLMGDESRLNRILVNLLGNAIKFTEEGFVSLHIRTIPRSANTATLSVQIQDSGIGIAEENYEMIFEKFTQADNSKTRQYGGAGLGLSISQSLVQAEGGELRLESKLGQGSKFSFDIQLPFESPLKAQEEKAQEAQVTLAPPLAPPLVPVVETKAGRALIIGQSEFSQPLKTQITALGLTPTSEVDVKAALIDMAKAFNTKQPYDVLIVDCDRPDLDGARLIQLIRSKPRLDSLKIIAVYAQDNLPLKDRLETLSIRGLAQPFELAALRAALSSAPIQFGSAA